MEKSVRLAWTTVRLMRKALDCEHSLEKRKSSCAAVSFLDYKLEVTVARKII